MDTFQHTGVVFQMHPYVIVTMHRNVFNYITKVVVTFNIVHFLNQQVLNLSTTTVLQVFILFWGIKKGLTY